MPYIYTPQLISALDESITQAELLADTPRTQLHVKVDRLIYEHLKAYLAMRQAEMNAAFYEAAAHAQVMLDLRKAMHGINSFFIMPHEDGHKTGVWYWKVTDRKKYYESLADKMSGKTGDLVAILPAEARFSTDPNDNGRFEHWYAVNHNDRRWQKLVTTTPFYRQGHTDDTGYPYTGNVWYRLAVHVPVEAADRKVTLYVPIVETEAWCWVNGEYVGHRPYQEAYIRPAEMELDVTDAIRPGQINQIVIRVNTGLGAAQAASGLMSRLFLYSPPRKWPLEVAPPPEAALVEGPG